jgi:hypothetical protein
VCAAKREHRKKKKKVNQKLKAKEENPRPCSLLPVDTSSAESHDDLLALVMCRQTNSPSLFLVFQSYKVHTPLLPPRLRLILHCSAHSLNPTNRAKRKLPKNNATKQMCSEEVYMQVGQGHDSSSIIHVNIIKGEFTDLFVFRESGACRATAILLIPCVVIFHILVVIIIVVAITKAAEHGA